MIISLENWTKRSLPERRPMIGQTVELQPWDRLTHGQKLWDAFGGIATNQLLFHFGWPTMTCWQDLAEILDRFNKAGEFITFVFCSKQSGAVLGMASYMSMVPENGVIETGSIAHSPQWQRTIEMTEAHYLMAKHIFDVLGYRRYEWKLNSTNAASHSAARRFGFSYEGLFRQHQVKPFGNRDTAWYSMLDSEWPQMKAAFEAWLAPSNFDADGKQRASLAAMTSKTLNAGAWTLHRANAHQLDPIIDFQKRAYAPTAQAIGGTPIPLEWDYQTLLGECEIWLAFDDKELIGVLIVRLRADDLFLESIGTITTKGLGKALMQASLERAMTLGRDKIRLMTNAKNPASSWYESLGFTIEHRQETADRMIAHYVLDL